MVVSAVDSFTATASGEVSAKVLSIFLLILVSFSVPRINFRFTSSERRRSLNYSITISQELIVPNIIVVISLHIGRLLFHVLHLPASWLLHLLLSLQFFNCFEFMHLLFKQVFLILKTRLFKAHLLHVSILQSLNSPFLFLVFLPLFLYFLLLFHLFRHPVYYFELIVFR